jgi:ABC-type glycerol-3-phosphate transport system substrate-binding protein
LKKKVFAVAVCFMLLFSGCTSTQGSDKDGSYASTQESSGLPAEESAAKTASGETSAEISGDLILRTCDDPSTISTWETYINSFHESYPNVKITLKAEGSPWNSETYRTGVSVEMFSGEAGDLLDLSFLPGPKYAESGLLVEVDSLLENMPGFSWESYYTNVFDAVRYKGGLYYVPYEMDLFGIRLNKLVSDQLDFQEEGRDTISIPELLELCRKANELPGLPEDFYTESGADWTFLSSFEMSSYVQEGNKSASFTSKEFIDYLENLKALPFPQNMRYGMYGSDQKEFPESQFYGFIALQPIGESNAQRYLESAESELVTKYMLTETSLGGKTFETNAIGITSSCKDLEAATAFVRFLLDTDIKKEKADLLSWMFPVNRRVNQEILRRSFGTGQEEVVQQMDKWCGQVDTLMLLQRSPELFAVLQEIMGEYMDGLISPEQCAQKLQERAEIYLQE